MERMTKRVGVNVAVTVGEEDPCDAYKKAGLCKTGIMKHSDGRYGFQNHCGDECLLGRMIDRLADYEDAETQKLEG